LGPVPVVGHDEKFKSGFTIHAEKCPNRRGVEAVIRHFSDDSLDFEQFLARLDGGEIRGVWVSGGYKQPMFDEAIAERFSDVGLLVVQDLFASPLWRRADYQLPGASFAERDGSYVNYADRLQSVKWAVRPPAGAWAEGQVYWRMLKRAGLYNARQVLNELAAEIPFFAVAGGEIPPTGVDLKLNQLAAT
jgi:NADH-quinone oxidoreductase subunit G